MSVKKTGFSVSSKIITVLLIMQTVLIGVQSKNRIQQGDSTIEVLIWMINQYIPVLQRVRRLKDKHKKRDGTECPP